MFDQVIENEEKIEDIHQEFVEMKEEFEETIEHIQEEQEIVQRHTNEKLEKLDGKIHDINSTLGKSFNF